MNGNLLIVGASTYSAIAYEIAKDMNCFEKIDFVDDQKAISANGKAVIGNVNSIEELSNAYKNVVVAIGNAVVRQKIINQIKSRNLCNLVSLVSPCAYISPNSKIMGGCIIEPMAVIHAGCTICEGCIISAGAVVNHESVCGDCVHIDCNATVSGYTTVPPKTKVASGTVFCSCT